MQECPRCGKDGKILKSECGELFCRTCYQLLPKTPALMPSSATRRRRKPVEPRVSEGDLQCLVVDWLEARGYTVMETGKSRSLVICPHCKGKHYPEGWQGNTPGLPDLFVTCSDWSGMWVAMELKTETGTVKPEQRRLADAGHSHIVRSLEKAIDVVQSIWGKWRQRA